MARKPNQRQHDRHRVDAEGAEPPRVGRGDDDIGKDNRSDDRDQENKPGREDEREDVDRAKDA